MTVSLHRSCKPSARIGQDLSRLQQLVELRLQASPPTFSMPVKCLAYMPTTLTLLQLDRLFVKRAVTQETAPRLQQLETLRHLYINTVHSFHPALLWSLPMLQHLQLEDAAIRGPTAAAEFMFVLSDLTQLQHLHLSNVLDKHSMLDVAQPYAALTASSQLTYLFLNRLALPQNTTSRIFPADRPCHELEEVGMDRCNFKRKSDTSTL